MILPLTILPPLVNSEQNDEGQNHPGLETGGPSGFVLAHPVFRWCAFDDHRSIAGNSAAPM